ncbi:hypothetical protein RUM43_002091 [Polyplax serrata]|uniref:receptor protein-tyrosine kinase n=1 Tax=Polyplax serrata TaxID=468196 RepID=A0AAN8NYC3_POLSC
MECTPKSVDSFTDVSYYECDITAKKTIHIKSRYSAYVEIEDTSVPREDPDRFYYQDITLEPTKFERLSAMRTAKPEDNFMLDLKYEEYAIVSKKAVVGTRVSEPVLVSSGLTPTETRKRMSVSEIKFKMLTPGAFNVTEVGGVVFVSNRHMLKEAIYRLKITGVYSNGYRFFSTVQVNVTDTKPSPGNEICAKVSNESLRPSCSEKRSKTECEKTCGVSTGQLKRFDGKGPATVGCSWRSNENPQKLSKTYQTCSPDLSTCPDRFCDSLEVLFPKICPQDCTEYVFGSANKENHLPGIASATGVCTCDNRQKCLCSLVTGVESSKQNERRKVKQTVNDTVVSRQREAISAMKASQTDNCGTVCFLSIAGGAVIFVCGTFTILLMIYRRRIKKRCPNQGPLKEDMVNINYEEYLEQPGDIIRPLTQSITVKEIPEYYDKKWEFPRYRLTIEETIGEGEFGKVLKARADGIGGNQGSTTVAVKTLKDNAKDCELADLISEYQLMKEIDHPNVIHLLGACTKLDGPIYIIIEYAKYGSLRNYLRKNRYVSYEQIVDKVNSVQAVTPKDILTFAWQIAKGMNYLTDMKLVHRDLAARNVLVAEGLICKISDFGLTRDIYEDDTYLKRSKGRVPVKWMALESLADHIYTTKSDVWSYGVVLWELVTTGSSPYPGIAGQNLFHLLKSGYRMEKPPNCSNELYQILRSCWHENPSHRPTFKSLVAKLEEMLGEGKDYLDLNPRTAENKTYFSEFLPEREESDVFLPHNSHQGSWQTPDNGVFTVKFEMFEKSCKMGCPVGKCACQLGLRYENEKVVAMPRYENEGMEDTGYVQPKGEPKLVNGLRSSPVCDTIRV